MADLLKSIRRIVPAPAFSKQTETTVRVLEGAGVANGDRSA